MSTLKSSAEHLTLNADGSGNDIKFQSNATEVAAIDQSGNLTLSGTVDGVDIAARDAILTSTTTTAGAALPKAGGTMTGTIAGFTSTGIDDNADATAITIDSSEKVGIGVTAPDSNLHVHGTGTLLSSDSYFVAQIQTDRNDNGSSDDGILQFVNGSNKTVKGEIRWDESSNTFELGHGDNANHIVIDSTGAVTMPNQPAFLVNAGSNTPIALSTDTKVNYSTEVFDQNSDFDTSTQTFTAPVSGKYQFNVQLLWLNWDSGATYYYIQIATSNRTYYELYNGGERSNDVQYSYGHIHVLADMDASDTAFVRITQVGGSVQTYYDTQSIWSGHLVC